MRPPLRLQEMPTWHEIPRKNKIISLTAGCLAAVIIVTVFIRSEMVLDELMWWMLMPVCIGLLIQAYNVLSFLPEWEDHIEERRRREAESDRSRR